MNEESVYQVFRITRSEKKTDSIRLLEFDRALEAQPGQFVMVWLPGRGEKPLCIANDQPLALAVAAIGPFSQAMHSAQTGERVWVRGPFGNGFSLTGKKHVMVGGGYGAAALLFLARQAREKNQEVMVCLGAKTQQELLMAAEFEALGCSVHLTTEDGSAGSEGLVTTALQHVLREKRADCVYGCGPVPMLTAVASICRQQAMPAQLSYEALMRCGIGLCGSCELEAEVRQAADIPPGWLTCKDGPVYFFNPDANAID